MRGGTARLPIALPDTPLTRQATGIAHKPETAFGNVKTDVLAEKLPGYVRPNFCTLVRASKLST